MQQSYDNIADEFSLSRAYPWPELQVFIPYLTDDSKILDLGCGNGRLIKVLENSNKKFSYIGVDFSANLIMQAKQIFPEYEFQVKDMREAEFPDNSFDLIAIVAAFHHLPTARHREEVMANVYRWLKPSGLLFMTNWNLFQKRYFPHIYNKLLSKRAWNDFFIPWNHGNFRYYHSFTQKELEKLLKKTGFVLEPKGVYKTEYNLNCLVRK